MEVEVVPTGALLEADAYIVVEVLEAAVVRMHSSDLKYRDCNYDPNMGWMGHEELMVVLASNISNAVVVVVNIRATKVLQNNYFMH